MVSRFAAWIGALGVVASMSVAPAGTAAGAGRLAEESTTTLTASPGSIIYGEDIEFTATVTGAVGTPTGAVEFRVDAQTIGGPITLDDMGTATFSAPFLLGSRLGDQRPLRRPSRHLRSQRGGDHADDRAGAHRVAARHAAQSGREGRRRRRVRPGHQPRHRDHALRRRVRPDRELRVRPGSARRGRRAAHPADRGRLPACLPHRGHVRRSHPVLQLRRERRVGRAHGDRAGAAARAASAAADHRLVRPAADVVTRGAT